ncbi:putative Amino acid permease [Taphrina deformans PYCC 5710]|uniref:Amino acid permease n=1 Tax=Taphrina deformans (strain PYCC 5710 / ATCC 11124 / CBS 356.35 / IMI 108563 / JCM 9778 / NBRC 8474) TaxID=1097556 RepID=R4XCJ6_TAPDE|nr:putative Amino acid permease [Taphrina deformans PYCC 5710]|eukprot:CCG83331.1 putative Amino acid permease [Taphrina deformans PYCC 5710]
MKRQVSPDKLSPATTTKYNDAGVTTEIYEGEHMPTHDVSESCFPLPARLTCHSIGGAIGTGLIIGTGQALSRAGPVGMLIAYAIVGIIVWFTMIALGEMATFVPNTPGFAGYATRFVDPALGLATGWNYWFKYVIVVPNQLTAAALVIRYWNTSINVAVWISIFIVVILIINLAGVKYFGEIEFWMSTIKVIVIVGLIILCICIAAGGTPKGNATGFHYWKNPGAFKQYLKTGNTGYFLGTWAVFVQATFAYLGTELVGVCVAEAENPRKTVPAAIKRTFYRILIFYIGLVFLLGLIVPSNSKELLGALKRSNSAAASPFVVAIQLAGIKYLNHILNGAILLFVLSAANSDLYIASRTLHSLAVDGNAPAIFKRTMKTGIPHYALGVSSLFMALAYLNVTNSAATVFKYFVNLVTVFGLLTWISIQVSHIQFRRGLKAQNIDPSTLPYRAPFQPWATWVALIASCIICFFKGYDTFLPSFNKTNFITSYLGIPLYLLLIAGGKVYYGMNSRVKPAEMDLFTGVRDFDADFEASMEKKAMDEEKNAKWYHKCWKYTGGAILG